MHTTSSTLRSSVEGAWAPWQRARGTASSYWAALLCRLFSARPRGQRGFEPPRRTGHWAGRRDVPSRRRGGGGHGGNAVAGAREHLLLSESDQTGVWPHRGFNACWLIPFELAYRGQYRREVTAMTSCTPNSLRLSVPTQEHDPVKAKHVLEDTELRLPQLERPVHQRRERLHQRPELRLLRGG